MRLTNKVHIALGIIPFTWFVLFLSILCAGSIRLGYIPVYGNNYDPYALGMDWLSLIHLVLFVLSMLAFFLWWIVAIIILQSPGNSLSIHKLSTILFVVGLSGYFIFRQFLPQNMDWVFD